MGNGFLCHMKNLEFSKEKNVSNILTERKKPVVKRYSNHLCELWFSGHMHSVFFFALGHNSHGVSFWREKWLKKLGKDCMATGTFQET